jgi:hypothetical protein
MACRSWIGTATYCMQSLGSAVVSDPRPFPRTSWLVKSERCRNGAIGESSTFRLFVSMMWSAVALDAPAARLRGRMFPCASIPENRRATT